MDKDGLKIASRGGTRNPQEVITPTTIEKMVRELSSEDDISQILPDIISWLNRIAEKA